MKQIENPYVRFRRKAQGRYANRLSGSVYGRGVSVDECFRVSDAVMGLSSSNGIDICFSKDLATCNTGWTFKKNGVAFTNVSLSGVVQPCIIFFADDGPTADSAGPDDTITADYVPGTCQALGENNCELDELTDYPIQNLIYGPVEARVSDTLGDNIIRIFYDVDPATVDATAWAVEVNSTPVTVTNAVISNNEIHLTISVSVASTDTVTYTQSGTVGNRVTAIDGRTSHWFYDEPVTNAVGTDYWAIADNSPWLLSSGVDTWSVA